MSAGDIFRELDRSIKSFTITDEHLKLLRRAYVGWDDCEFGAPAIDCKRPYGNSYVVGDIAEIISGRVDDNDEEMPRETEGQLTRLHAETGIALQIVLTTGEFKAGEYARENSWSGWTAAACDTITKAAQ